MYEQKWREPYVESGSRLAGLYLAQEEVLDDTLDHCPNHSGCLDRIWRSQPTEPFYLFDVLNSAFVFLPIDIITS